MRFRFSDDQWLGIYKSDVFGNFRVSATLLREGAWEWQLTCDKRMEKQIGARTYQLPMKGLAESREDAQKAVAILYEIDPNARPIEFHDGYNRVSVYFGLVRSGEGAVVPGVRSPQISATEMGGVQTMLSVTRVEKWD